jgi:hypothetical protein
MLGLTRLIAAVAHLAGSLNGLADTVDLLHSGIRQQITHQERVPELPAPPEEEVEKVEPEPSGNGRRKVKV